MCIEIIHMLRPVSFLTIFWSVEIEDGAKGASPNRSGGSYQAEVVGEWCEGGDGDGGLSAWHCPLDGGSASSSLADVEGVTGDESIPLVHSDRTPAEPH